MNTANEPTATEAVPEQALTEYLGDITSETANEMLAGLVNINRFMNRIHDARDMGYMVEALHGVRGNFVGLVLTPKNAEDYAIRSEIVPLSTETREKVEALLQELALAKSKGGN